MEAELRMVFALFDVEYPRNVAVAVQDHGYSPHRSNRIHRFELMRERLDAGDWDLLSLAADPVLPDMTRMQAIREQAPGALVTEDVYKRQGPKSSAAESAPSGSSRSSPAPGG